MLYYLGSHRWLWGRGGVGVSARDHAAPVHSSSRTHQTCRGAYAVLPATTIYLPATRRHHMEGEAEQEDDDESTINKRSLKPGGSAIGSGVNVLAR